jgi:hypothetical protein
MSWAFEQQIRPPARKLLLIALSDDTGFHHPSASALVVKTSMSIPEIENHWNALVKSGHINELFGEGVRLAP